MAWKMVEEELPAVKAPEESTLGMLGRNLVSGAANVASGFAGVPGEAAHAFQSFRESKSLSPEYISQIKNPVARKYLEQARKDSLGGPEILPTTEQIKSTIGKALPEDYLAPRNEQEKIFQDFSEDVGSLLFPLGGKPATSALRILGKAGAISGAGNAASFITKELGGSEGMQKGVKIGTMLLTSFGLQDSLKQRAKNAYDRIEKEIPNNAAIRSEPIREATSKLIAKVDSGAKSIADKRAVRELLQDLDEISSGKNTNLKQLIEFKRDLGPASQALYKSPRAQAWVGDLAKDINHVLKKSGEVSPDISFLLNQSDELWSAVKRSENAVKFIKGIPGIAKYLGGGALGLLGYTNPAAIPAAASVGAGVTGGIHGFNIIRNIVSNKSARNEYIKMMNGALKESAPMVTKHAKNLREILNREETQGTWRMVE